MSTQQAPLKQPSILPIAGDGAKTLYILEEDYVYSYRVRNGFMRIVVPKGFVYDGATVPRIFWTATGITPDGLQRAAALVHDWIYVNKGKLPDGSQSFKSFEDKFWSDVAGRWTRLQCDKLFRRMLLQAGIPEKKADLMYNAVRVGGYFFWKDSL